MDHEVCSASDQAVDYIVEIRRITQDEMMEFLELMIDYSDFPIYAADGDLSSELTRLVCEATLGNLVLSVAQEDRGLAALIRLKWGRTG